MFCKNCGASLSETASFCGKCGTSASNNTENVKEKKTYSWSTTRMVDKIVLTALPAGLFFIAINALYEENSGGFFVYISLFIVSIISLSKKENKQGKWFFYTKWQRAMYYLAWVLVAIFCVSFLAGILLVTTSSFRTK